MLDCVRPDWPVPSQVCALQTRRDGGLSAGVYRSLNLGDHVGDAAEAVAGNRRRLCAALGFEAEPRWLRQVHGTRVAALPSDETRPEADACWTATPGVVCTVLTADCLPVLFAAADGSVVAAAHAGWRGLAAGVLEATVAAMPVAPARVMAWLGAAIGPQAFEVGPEVRETFLCREPQLEACFTRGRADRWHADLHALARAHLRRAGVTDVYGAISCTVSDPQAWFSHRRDGVSGRMASLIWIDPRRCATDAAIARSSLRHS